MSDAELAVEIFADDILFLATLPRVGEHAILDNGDGTYTWIFLPKGTYQPKWKRENKQKGANGATQD